MTWLIAIAIVILALAIFIGITVLVMVDKFEYVVLAAVMMGLVWLVQHILVARGF